MKIAMLLSGGVDSSVALARLCEQGHEVTAFYLKIWLQDELSFLGDCPWEEDLSYARAVCAQLQVPLEVVPLQEAYHDKIVSYTLESVKAGLTPSPDVMCNTFIKFGVFLDYLGNRFEKVASGHYAQVALDDDGVAHLYKNPDSIKDQTYFLSRMTQQQLQRALFPIGDLTKKEVRELATRYNLPTKDRKDSQGICFLGKISFAQFIEHYVGTRTGDIVEYETGRVLGQHQGYWFYTIGQRKGLRLSGGPWFVVQKNIEHNIISVSSHYYDSDKKRNAFSVTQLHWLTDRLPVSTNLNVKIRHGAADYAARILWYENGADVIIPTDDQGVAPGQIAVFYDGNECLGCGVIV